MTHPSAPALDAIAAGDAPGQAAAHLETCEACAAYVAKLRDEASAFRAQTDPAAFAEKIRKRAGAVERERRGARVIWLLGPMVAAAAAVLLWLRAPKPPVLIEETPAASSSSEVTHFKGGMAVAAIRDREGRQERMTGPFEVEPSDRIRVEVAVDHEAPVTAGLLADDGTWTPLLAPASLSIGTHYSDLAARFDDTPTDAMLLVGSPPDIERARRTRDFDGVVAWRVRSAPRR